MLGGHPPGGPPGDQPLGSSLGDPPDDRRGPGRVPTWGRWWHNSGEAKPQGDDQSELAIQQTEINKHMYLNSYKPKGTPLSPKLTSTSNTEEVSQFCHTFKLYIKGGKMIKSIDIPLNIVIGCLAEHIQTNFFDTTLCCFIENNIPNYEEIEGEPMEDRVINIIYHYYMTMTLLHAQINPFHSYKHQRNESFDTFMARAERIITRYC